MSATPTSRRGIARLTTIGGSTSSLWATRSIHAPASTKGSRSVGHDFSNICSARDTRSASSMVTER
jgi:hypothetical protein